MNFDWDDSKHDLVQARRGFSFADVVPMFDGHISVDQDTRQDYGEVRMAAVGKVGEKFFTVVYTDRADTRWIITAWPSNRKERAAWHESL